MRVQTKHVKKVLILRNKVSGKIPDDMKVITTDGLWDTIHSTVCLFQDMFPMIGANVHNLHVI